MPLSVNVGLSRKASKDYQSTGVSINVTAELDSTLLAKPHELQTQIENLYAQAEQALSRKAPNLDPQSSERAIANRYGDRGNGRDAGAAKSHDVTGASACSSIDRPMTANQRRAIGTIALRLNVDAQVEAR